MNGYVKLAAAFVFLGSIVFGEWAAACDGCDPRDPLLQMFRAMEPGMEKETAERIIAERVGSSRGRIRVSPGTDMVSFSWDGEDLFKEGQAPLSSLQVIYRNERLWCATHVFLYAGGDRPVLEPLHKGANECRLMY